MSKVYLLLISIVFSGVVSAQVITSIIGTNVAGFNGDTLPPRLTQLALPDDVAIDKWGNLYISDGNNRRIRKMKPDGTITTIAGTGESGDSGDGGPATAATMKRPSGIAVDKNGNVFVADLFLNKIRVIDASGIIRTYAGNGITGFSGDGGKAVNAKISNPYGLCVDTAGNLYFTDFGCQGVRKVTPAGIISTIAGTGAYGFNHDNGVATAIVCNNPHGVCVDKDGNILFTDTDNNRVRKVSPDGMITTIAGNGGYGQAGDGRNATNAELMSPRGITADVYGNVYVSEYNGYRVRKISPSGIITTVAGTGNFGYSGDGGSALNAEMKNLFGLALDSCNNLYIADGDNHLVRKVSVMPPGLRPEIKVSASYNDTICTGVSLTFERHRSGTGLFYDCRWFVNDSETGDTASKWMFAPKNNDAISCRLITRNTCGPILTQFSNRYVARVNSNKYLSIELEAPDKISKCAEVGVVAKISGATGSYKIEWFLNGAYYTTTETPSFVYVKENTVDRIQAKITSTATGNTQTAWSDVAVVASYEGEADVVDADAVEPFVFSAGTKNLTIICKEHIETAALSNLDGEELISGCFNGQSGHAELDISKLPSDTYVLKINGIKRKGFVKL
jgi:sugar lactone lactonase YvrE